MARDGERDDNDRQQSNQVIITKHLEILTYSYLQGQTNSPSDATPTHPTTSTSNGQQGTSTSVPVPSTSAANGQAAEEVSTQQGGVGINN